MLYPKPTCAQCVPVQVILLWAVNYTGEQQVPMVPSPGGDPGTYTASIPAGVTDPGSMIRWAVQVRFQLPLYAATFVQYKELQRRVSTGK